jgi:hypothetical protein
VIFSVPDFLKEKFQGELLIMLNFSAKISSYYYFFENLKYANVLNYKWYSKIGHFAGKLTKIFYEVINGC